MKSTKATITEQEVKDLYNSLLELKAKEQDHLTPEQMAGYRVGISMSMAFTAYKLLGKVIIEHVKL